MTPTQPETALDRAKARVAEFGHQGIEDPDIDFCVFLARVLTAEGTDEKLARLIDTEAWVEEDFGWTWSKGVREAAQAVAYAKARLILTLLAEMAEAG